MLRIQFRATRSFYEKNTIARREPFKIEANRSKKRSSSILNKNINQSRYGKLA